MKPATGSTWLACHLLPQRPASRAPRDPLISLRPDPTHNPTRMTDRPRRKSSSPATVRGPGATALPTCSPIAPRSPCSPHSPSCEEDSMPQRPPPCFPCPPAPASSCLSAIPLPSPPSLGLRGFFSFRPHPGSPSNRVFVTFSHLLASLKLLKLLALHFLYG